MKRRDREHLKAALDDKFSCYVLITCSKPSQEGQMEVEMSYEGDSALASYLLQGAQTLIEQEEEYKSVS